MRRAICRRRRATLKKLIAVLQSGFGALLPSCRDASGLQSEALDKPLSFSKRFGLSLHLLICKWCRRYGKQIGFLRNAAHEHPEKLSDAVPQRLSNEARE